jgi:sec-independent protein translocase protein TatB
MFEVSFSEILVILIITLLVFGPERLPEMASKIGKIMGQLRQHSNAIRREFYNTVYTPAEEIKRDIAMSTRNLNAFKTELEQDFKDVTSLEPPPTTTPEPAEPISTPKPQDDGSNKAQ